MMLMFSLVGSKEKSGVVFYKSRMEYYLTHVFFSNFGSIFCFRDKKDCTNFCFCKVLTTTGRLLVPSLSDHSPGGQSNPQGRLFGALAFSPE
jgi:hypothetical protein